VLNVHLGLLEGDAELIEKQDLIFIKLSPLKEYSIFCGKKMGFIYNGMKELLLTGSASLKNVATLMK
jgi:hypothetical protein